MLTSKPKTNAEVLQEVLKVCDRQSVKLASKFVFSFGGLSLGAYMVYEICACGFGVPEQLWSSYRFRPDWALAPRSFALDGDTLYWVEGGAGMIIETPVELDAGWTSYPAKLADSRPIVAGLKAPHSVAFHPGTQTVFWTDAGTGKVSRVSLRDNATQGLNISTHEDILVGVPDPSGIALDFVNSFDGTTWIYWGSGGTGSPHAVLWRLLVHNEMFSDPLGWNISADSEMAEVVVPYSSTDGGVGGLALDQARGKIYWSLTAGRRIHRANLDGTHAEIFIDSDDLERPEALVFNPLDDNLYWSDSIARKIMRAPTQDDPAAAENVWKSASAHTPRGLALDQEEGILFWGDFAETGILHGTIEGECWLIKAFGQKLVSMMFMAFMGCCGLSATIVMMILLLGAYSGQCCQGGRGGGGHVFGRGSGRASGGGTVGLGSYFQPAMVGIMVGDMFNTTASQQRRARRSQEAEATRQKNLQRFSADAFTDKIKPMTAVSSARASHNMKASAPPAHYASLQLGATDSKAIQMAPYRGMGNSSIPPSGFAPPSSPDAPPPGAASVLEGSCSRLQSPQAPGAADGNCSRLQTPQEPQAPQGTEIMTSTPEPQPIGNAQRFLQPEDEPLDVDDRPRQGSAKCCVLWS